MLPKPSAGLIYGPDAHYIDHIGVLCHVLKIPLLVTEEEIAAKISRYYPQLEVILLDYFSIAEHLVSHYDVIFYSMPRALFDEVFFFAQKLLQKKIQTIWCPHGNSDKGGGIAYMEALKQEEAALVYGEQMIDFLKRKGVFNPLKAHLCTGNFRYQFYLKNKAFYDQIFSEEIARRLPKAEKTLLYAPTWQDYEKSSSFFGAISPLVEKLPESWNLLVKLHPNLLLQEEMQVQDIIDAYSERSSVLFVKDFPPIYPLLSHVDLYIGDLSSIGYDFLTFDRPLFFLNPDGRNSQEIPLFRAGVEIQPDQYENLYSIIQNFLSFEVRDYSSIRKAIYAHTFGEPKTLTTLCEEVGKMPPFFKDPELHFF